MFYRSIWLPSGKIASSSWIVTSAIPPPDTCGLSSFAPPSIDEGLSPHSSVRTPLASLVKDMGAHYERQPQLVGPHFLAFVPSKRNVEYLSWLASNDGPVLMVQTFSRTFSLCIRLCRTSNCDYRCIYPYLSSCGSSFLSASIARPSKL